MMKTKTIPGTHNACKIKLQHVGIEKSGFLHSGHGPTTNRLDALGPHARARARHTLPTSADTEHTAHQIGTLGPPRAASDIQLPLALRPTSGGETRARFGPALSPRGGPSSPGGRPPTDASASIGDARAPAARSSRFSSARSTTPRATTGSTPLLTSSCTAATRFFSWKTS